MKYLKEWLIVNKNGFYSSSTVSQAHTRSYHGLYVTLENDFSRNVLLSKMWEKVIFNGEEFYLDTNYFGDIIHPTGYRYLYNYEDFPIPMFTFRINELVIEKNILWDPNVNTLYINYSFPEAVPDEFELNPLLAFRKAGYVNKDIEGIDVNTEGNEVIFRGRSMKLISNNGEYFRINKDVYRNFTYNEEKQRGYDFYENLFRPGTYNFEKEKEIIMKFYMEYKETDIAKSKNAFIKFLSPAFNNSEIPNRTQGILNYFLLQDNIIAGYPWFGAWSRDTLIAIPGLLLTRGRFDQAKRVLKRIMEKYNDGIFKNCEKGDIVNADSPLLFIYAMKKYLDYSNDISFLRSSINFIDKIMNNYSNGFEGIKMEDALISVPEGRTWMDAKCEGRFITPRNGKPVEINALWYNALSSIKEFYYKLNIKPPENYDEVIAKVRTKFLEKFVDGNRIKDVADPDDISIRPNMIFAFSLPYPVLTNLRPFMDSIKELVTPFGLRTLSPRDKKYVAVYEGDQCSRDNAYHNGTIWPWLAGPYITASVRSGIRKDHLANYFRVLMSLDYIPEIFDGSIPDIPRGSVIQAWSYAEIVRAFVEDLR